MSKKPFEKSVFDAVPIPDNLMKEESPSKLTEIAVHQLDHCKQILELRRVLIAAITVMNATLNVLVAKGILTDEEVEREGQKLYNQVEEARNAVEN